MPDDGFRYELVRGELRKMPSAGNEHGYIAREVLGELRSHVKANGLGRVYAAVTGFEIHSNPDPVRAPDVAFVSRERLEEVGPPSKATDPARRTWRWRSSPRTTGIPR